MKKSITIFACLVSFHAFTQTTDKWDLRRCVDYATKNNISVKQAAVQAKLSALQVKQAQYNLFPTANFSSNLGGQFGRSIDPTTNQFTTTQLLSQSYTLQGNMTIYNWGRLRYTLSSQKNNLSGALLDIEKTVNDISLNIANAYLLSLSSKEQIRVAEIQVEQTQQQLEITKKQYAAGSVPELNVLQLEAKLSSDSSNLITAKSSYDVNILSLKALLNIDEAETFLLDSPDIEKIPVESFADLQPDVVYQLALKGQPQQKSFAYKIKGAEESVKANKAALYPSFGVGYSLSTNFANFLKSVDPSSFAISGASPTGNYVTVSGTNYLVYQPNYTYSYVGKSFGDWWKGYGSQLSDNFTQRIGIGVSIPIFSNGQNRVQYESSKLNLANLKLQSEQADYTLKQNIYTAYANAIASYQKYIAGKKNVESTQKAYDFAAKRYEIGLLGILDLITNQNNLTTAKLNLIVNQYDYVFKMKLLEFYKGQGLKL
ncbi:MAG: TolC family protein [Sphingobacteriia bacterium]|nr:TolC family protein [Sphingobacteriia bacterium]